METKQPCPWCQGSPGVFFDVNWYNFPDAKVPRGEVRYCPYCGREIGRARDGQEKA